MEANQQYVQVEAVQPVVESANEAQSEPRMVDIMESQGGDKKRKAEDEKEPDSVKRPKLGAYDFLLFWNKVIDKCSCSRGYRSFEEV